MSCKPTYKGVRYNSLEELYRANGVNPQQKQQAQIKFQEYINTTGRQDIKGFKEFVQGKPSQVENMVDGVPNINNEEKSLKLALKGLTPEEKISFCNHFGITMTEENGKKC